MELKKIKLIDLENENVKSNLEEIKEHYEITIKELQQTQDYDKYLINQYEKYDYFDLVDIGEIPYIIEDIKKREIKIDKLKKQYKFILDILEVK